MPERSLAPVAKTCEVTLVWINKAELVCCQVANVKLGRVRILAIRFPVNLIRPEDGTLAGDEVTHLPCIWVAWVVVLHLVGALTNHVAILVVANDYAFVINHHGCLQALVSDESVGCVVALSEEILFALDTPPFAVAADTYIRTLAAAVTHVTPNYTVWCGAIPLPYFAAVSIAGKQADFWVEFLLNIHVESLVDFNRLVVGANEADIHFLIRVRTTLWFQNE